MFLLGFCPSFRKLTNTRKIYREKNLSSLSIRLNRIAGAAGKSGQCVYSEGIGKAQRREKNPAMQLSVEQRYFSRSPEIAVFNAAVFY